MMKLGVGIMAAMGAVLLSTSAIAECNRPPEPTLNIDGTSSTMDEIKAAYSKVLEYKDAIEGEEGFLRCLEAEDGKLEDQMKAIGDDDAESDEAQQIAEARQRIVQRYNAAVDSLKEVAAEFNTEYKVFKAEQGS